MKLDKQPNQCCGCSACAEACPTGAIRMLPDAEGFLYPSIDNDKCVDCGACVKVCSFNADYQRAKAQIETRCHAVVHQDPVTLRKSRSGGVFFALATAVIAKGGVVFGVALDEAFCARTVRIDAQKGLSALQGSKYVQSDKGNSFSRVADDLKAGRTVLFSGTACEVSGLYGYLRKAGVNEENLYTCDLICHGAPSPKLWQDNLAYMSKKLGGTPDAVSFRDKCFGWAPHIESYTRGETTKYANRYTSVFYGDAALRPACSQCHFANLQRCSDMTLADFWGVGALELPIDAQKGVSCLLTHTQKANDLLSAASDITLYPTSTDALRQPNLSRPTPASPQREAFWSDYHRRGYLAASRRFYGLKERLKLAYNYFVRRQTK